MKQPRIYPVFSGDLERIAEALEKEAKELRIHAQHIRDYMIGDTGPDTKTLFYFNGHAKFKNYCYNPFSQTNALDTLAHAAVSLGTLYGKIVDIPAFEETVDPGTFGEDIAVYVHKTEGCGYNECPPSNTRKHENLSGGRTHWRI